VKVFLEDNEAMAFYPNKDKSGASFCRQVAAWLPDMFFNLYLVNNHIIYHNSTTTEVR
jgi:hypothetical protein